MWGAVVGSVVVLPGILLSSLGFLRWGITPAAIVVGMFLRVGTTLSLAGFVVWKFPELRSLDFFAGVTVVYLASLFIETTLAWKSHQRDVARDSHGRFEG